MLDAVPLLPPYAHLDEEAVHCVAQASSRYDVPELLLHSILLKEDGRTGQCSKANSNGTRDCGLAQINTTWVPHFQKQGIPASVLYGNACTNIQAAAYILRSNYLRKRDWFEATVAYNIGPNNWTPVRKAIGWKYATDVTQRWWSLHTWVTAQPAAPTK